MSYAVSTCFLLLVISCTHFVGGLKIASGNKTIYI